MATRAFTKNTKSPTIVKGAGEAPGTAMTVGHSGALPSALCLAPTAGRLALVLATAALSLTTLSCGFQPDPQPSTPQPMTAAISAPISQVPLFTTAAPQRHYFDPRKIP